MALVRAVLSGRNAEYGDQRSGHDDDNGERDEHADDAIPIGANSVVDVLAHRSGNLTLLRIYGTATIRLFAEGGRTPRWPGDGARAPADVVLVFDGGALLASRQVPSRVRSFPMALYEIRVHFETEDAQQVEQLTDGVERLICPHPPHSEHRCPNRWNIMTIELDEADAAEVDELLNDR